MRVNILFDDRRIELYEVILAEMERQRITDYRICNPILDNSIVTSINISQKQIVAEAKDLGHNECYIMEQDVWFPAEDGWQYFLNNKPKEFDIYIGGSYLVDNRIDYISPVTKVNEWVGNHCIIIHEKYYDTFLDTDENLHIDTAQAGRGDFYLCYPMAALQRPSKSANNGYELVNYNKILTKEKIYGEVCNV